MAKDFLGGYKTYDSSKGFGDAKQWQEAFYLCMKKEDADEVLKAQSATPFDILELNPGATPAEITKAFRKMIMLWHPDRNQHRIKEAEEMSKKIIAAYSVLT